VVVAEEALVREVPRLAGAGPVRLEPEQQEPSTLVVVVAAAVEIQPGAQVARALLF
jgi:hypothetical protein